MLFNEDVVREFSDDSTIQSILREAETPEGLVISMLNFFEEARELSEQKNISLSNEVRALNKKLKEALQLQASLEATKLQVQLNLLAADLIFRIEEQLNVKASWQVVIENKYSEILTTVKYHEIASALKNQRLEDAHPANRNDFKNMTWLQMELAFDQLTLIDERTRAKTILKYMKARYGQERIGPLSPA